MIFAETRRLILRRPREADLESLMPGWADPEMTRYTNPRPDPRAFLASMIADAEAGYPRLRASRAKAAAHPIEAVGARLRALGKRDGES